MLTHGFWVLPSAYGGVNLFLRSYTSAQLLAAIIYGVALSMLFFVSTFFHCVFYCNRNRPLKDVLHRCDRAMIYIFIAGSYYPWLSLGHTTHPQIVSVIKWCVWVLAIMGIIYQQVGLNFMNIFAKQITDPSNSYRCFTSGSKVWRRSSIWSSGSARRWS